MKFISVAVVAIVFSTGALAGASSPFQTASELQAQAKKLEKLMGRKQITCARQKGAAPGKLDDADYGEFAVSANQGKLAFTGNPGEKSLLVEAHVGEFTVFHFGGNSGSTRYLAFVDYAGNLYEAGESEGELIQMDDGQLVRSTRLDCKLK